MKKKYLNIALWVIAAIWIGFIWWNSSKPGTESGAMSGSVTDMVNAIVNKIFPSIEISHHFIRKFAHFSEFAVLGSLLCVSTSFAFGISRASSVKKHLLSLIALPCAITVAAIDECIQLFVPGRAGAFGDVLIDSSGAATGVLLVFAILLLIRLLHKKESAECA